MVGKPVVPGHRPRGPPGNRVVRTPGTQQCAGPIAARRCRIHTGGIVVTTEQREMFIAYKQSIVAQFGAPYSIGLAEARVALAKLDALFASPEHQAFLAGMPANVAAELAGMRQAYARRAGSAVVLPPTDHPVAPVADVPVIYTIGHSNVDFETFLRPLQSWKITLLVDVRSKPWSRFPHFNQKPLQERLAAVDIAYHYSGQQLGGQPQGVGMYKHGYIPKDRIEFLREVDYDKVMQQPWFQTELERILTISRKQTVVLMCSEANHRDCHRHHLIEKAIGNRAVVRHLSLY